MNLQSKSLNEVEQLYKAGRITEQELIDYIKAWNSGPHFTQSRFQ